MVNSIWEFKDLRKQNPPLVDPGFGIVIDSTGGSLPLIIDKLVKTKQGKENFENHLFDICPFCSQNLMDLEKTAESSNGLLKMERVSICLLCGWHGATSASRSFGGGLLSYEVKGISACLKELDVTDLNVPIEEIQNYLIAKYETRFEVHPKKFELLVAEVFRALGYHAVVTGYTGDNGIDVILDNGSKQIGVQVKRYKNSIKVEQIRALVGSLVLGGFTQGMFITTSNFQSGANRYIDRYQIQGYRIELINSEKFYSALGINKSFGKHTLDNLDLEGFKKKQQSLVTKEAWNVDFEDYGTSWGGNFPEPDELKSIFE